jgi:glycosyltransferase involved in cell wall biosynthesis
MSVRRVRDWPKEFDLYLAPGIYSAIRDGSWDLIHFQGYSTFVVPVGLFATVRRSLPFVLTFHSGGHSSRLRNAVRGTQQALLRPLVVRADRLIGVSEFEADFFSARMGVPRKRFTVIPNGAEMPTPSSGVVFDPNRIVSIGRLERYKGHHKAIAAMPEVIRKIPEAMLHVAGAGPYEEVLRRQVQALGLNDRVTIGAVPSGDRQAMADLLASAGLVVLFSEYEAHPIAVMEALALRRPVLVSDTSGLAEIAANGLCRAIPCKAGPVETAAAIAAELRTCRSIPRVTLPDWDDCSDALIDLYRGVMADRSAASGPSGSDRLALAQAGAPRR